MRPRVKRLSHMQRVLLIFLAQTYQAEYRRPRQRDGIAWGLPGMPRVTQIDVSRSLRRLEARGLIVRVRPHGRTTHLRLREAGLRVAEQLMRQCGEYHHVPHGGTDVPRRDIGELTGVCQGTRVRTNFWGILSETIAESTGESIRSLIPRFCPHLLASFTGPPSLGNKALTQHSCHQPQTRPTWL